MSVPGSILERPFYFIVALWGERFRNYFLEYCLPSLLSENNIPVLTTRQRSKFLIATRPDDWEAMRVTEIFRRLEKYLMPVFLEIPPCPPNKSGCEHMGIGHKLACEMAYAAGAYGIALTPDCMLSDGTVARLQELAGANTQVVLAAALRFGEEPFLGDLRSKRLISETSCAATGVALQISGRQMVHAAINGFHSQTLSYEWESPYFNAMNPAAVWWRVPGEDGVLIHCMSWAPLLIDYSAIHEHDTSTFDKWTMDGDYIYKNFGDAGVVYVCTDSDEMFIASWAPLAEGAVDLSSHPFGPFFIKAAIFRNAFYSALYDPLKRKLFFLPVYWHANALNTAWSNYESAAKKILRKEILWGDTTNVFRLFPRKLMLGLRMACSGFAAFIGRLSYLLDCWHRNGGYVMRRTAAALHGNRAAQRYIIWRLRVLGWQIISGNCGASPMPELPLELLPTNAYTQGKALAGKTRPELVRTSEIGNN